MGEEIPAVGPSGFQPEHQAESGTEDVKPISLCEAKCPKGSMCDHEIGGGEGQLRHFMAGRRQSPASFGNSTCSPSTNVN